MKMKNKTGTLFRIVATMTIIVYPALMQAHGETSGATSGNTGMSMKQAKMKGGFLVRKEIDGYQVSFHIMKAGKGASLHGASYSFMIRIEKNGKVITNAIVNSRAIHPVGESESRMMMRMGDWYMANYDLSHKGRHQLMVLFKTADGAKHFGGVFYPGK